MAIIPLRTVARARVSTSVVRRCCLSPLFVPHGSRGKKDEAVIRVGRRKQSRTGDIVIWASDSRPRTAAITPGRGIAGREPVAISPSLPSRKKAKRCSRSRAKYGACCVSRDDRPRWRGTNRARTSFASSIFLFLVRSIRHNGTRHPPLTPEPDTSLEEKGEREEGKRNDRKFLAEFVARFSN